MKTDITGSCKPRSDQLNAEDLLGGDIEITITGFDYNETRDPSPLWLYHDHDPKRPYKPCLTMRKVLSCLWSKYAEDFVGRRLLLYRDPTVTFGRDEVGGIRIRAMSHIDAAKTVLLTKTRGKRKRWRIEALPERQTQAPSGDKMRAAIMRAIDAFSAAGVAQDELEARTGKPAHAWTMADLQSLRGYLEQLRSVEE